MHTCKKSHFVQDFSKHTVPLQQLVLRPHTVTGRRRATRNRPPFRMREDTLASRPVSRRFASADARLESKSWRGERGVRLQGGFGTAAPRAVRRRSMAGPHPLSLLSAAPAIPGAAVPSGSLHSRLQEGGSRWLVVDVPP